MHQESTTIGNGKRVSVPRAALFQNQFQKASPLILEPILASSSVIRKAGNLRIGFNLDIDIKPFFYDHAIKRLIERSIVRLSLW